MSELVSSINDVVLRRHAGELVQDKDDMIHEEQAKNNFTNLIINLVTQNINCVIAVLAFGDAASDAKTKTW